MSFLYRKDVERQVAPPAFWIDAEDHVMVQYAGSGETLSCYPTRLRLCGTLSSTQPRHTVQLTSLLGLWRRGGNCWRRGAGGADPPAFRASGSGTVSFCGAHEPSGGCAASLLLCAEGRGAWLAADV